MPLLYRLTANQIVESLGRLTPRIVVDLATITRDLQAMREEMGARFATLDTLAD